jgi:hypothetical protein
LDRPGAGGAGGAGMPRGQARFRRPGSSAGWINSPPKAAPCSRRVWPHASIALDRGHGIRPAWRRVPGGFGGKEGLEPSRA